MTFDEPNYDRSDNEKYIASLVSDHNYIDRGWTNKGAAIKKATQFQNLNNFRYEYKRFKNKAAMHYR